MDPLIALEAALDAALVDWRTTRFAATPSSEAAERWSAAIWRAAVAQGPAPLSGADRALARIVPDPVLICGAPRSGTTLMRDLLDGHPALAVLPSEGRFFGDWEQRLPPDPAAATERFGREWLERLANPVNQPPYWLLGRSDPQQNRYVLFARLFLSWSETLRSGHGDMTPLLALVMTLAMLQPGEPSSLRHWVDKTPGYETRLARIWSRFPAAKVILMTRRPKAVTASHTAGAAQTDVPTTPTALMLRNLARSHAAARSALAGARAGQVLVVPYEALNEQREPMMARVAEFLGVPCEESLRHPSCLGRPAEPNSSFHGRQRTAFEARSVRERVWLALAEWRHARLQSAAARPT